MGVFLFISGFMVVMISRVAKLDNKNERINFVRKSFPLTSIITVSVYLFFLMFSNKLIPLFLGDKYLPAIGTFLIILPAYLYEFMISPLAMCLTHSIGNPKPIVIFRIFMFLIVFAMYIYIAPIFGIIGLAYVLLSESLIYNTFVGICSFKKIFYN
jgi:O-antigen/teichoic acid export membrane protein